MLLIECLIFIIPFSNHKIKIHTQTHNGIHTKLWDHKVGYHCKQRDVSGRSKTYIEKFFKIEYYKLSVAPPLGENIGQSPV